MAITTYERQRKDGTYVGAWCDMCGRVAHKPSKHSHELVASLAEQHDRVMHGREDE